MTDNVTHFHPHRMTQEEYERERSTLRETYGDNGTEAAAKRDQALALLFARSNWTQEQLARNETAVIGKKVTQPWIARRLLFGRFLNFMPDGINADWSPNNLTEGKFRSYWERTEGSNERQRFAAVQKLMAEDLVLRSMVKRPKIGQDMVEKFADGKWHSPEAIAKALDTTPDHVESTLHTMLGLGTYGTKCEKKPVGKGHHYRIFRKTRTVSSDELATKLKPIVDGLLAEGRKSIVTMSPPTVAHLASQLAKLLEEWS